MDLDAAVVGAYERVDDARAQARARSPTGTGTGHVRPVEAADPGAWRAILPVGQLVQLDAPADDNEVSTVSSISLIRRPHIITARPSAAMRRMSLRIRTMPRGRAR